MATKYAQTSSIRAPFPPTQQNPAVKAALEKARLKPKYADYYQKRALEIMAHDNIKPGVQGGISVVRSQLYNGGGGYVPSVCGASDGRGGIQCSGLGNYGKITIRPIIRPGGSGFNPNKPFLDNFNYRLDSDPSKPGPRAPIIDPNTINNRHRNQRSHGGRGYNTELIAVKTSEFGSPAINEFAFGDQDFGSDVDYYEQSRKLKPIPAKRKQKHNKRRR